MKALHVKCHSIFLFLIFFPSINVYKRKVSDQGSIYIGMFVQFLCLTAASYCYCNGDVKFYRLPRPKPKP